MNLGTLDLSTLPPTLAWCLVVIVIVCKILPDTLGLSASTTISRQPSTAGTPSPSLSTAKRNLIASVG